MSLIENVTSPRSYVVWCLKYSGNGVTAQENDLSI